MRSLVTGTIGVQGERPEGLMVGRRSWLALSSLALAVAVGLALNVRARQRQENGRQEAARLGALLGAEAGLQLQSCAAPATEAGCALHVPGATLLGRLNSTLSVALINGIGERHAIVRASDLPLLADSAAVQIVGFGDADSVEAGAAPTGGTETLDFGRSLPVVRVLSKSEAERLPPRSLRFKASDFYFPSTLQLQIRELFGTAPFPPTEFPRTIMYERHPGEGGGELVTALTVSQIGWIPQFQTDRLRVTPLRVELVERTIRLPGLDNRIAPSRPVTIFRIPDLDLGIDRTAEWDCTIAPSDDPRPARRMCVAYMTESQSTPTVPLIVIEMSTPGEAEHRTRYFYRQGMGLRRIEEVYGREKYELGQ